MDNRNQSPLPMWIARGVVAGTLAIGLSAGLLMMTYAATGNQTAATATATSGVATTATPKPATTANPTARPIIATAKPAASATPAAPPVLGATYDNRAFSCGSSFCDTSTITVYVPNAPDSTWIGVQWLDSSVPMWRNVEGWQGNLDILNNNHQLPFKQWTVFHTNFGQGPFRYILMASPNGPVLGLSPEFNLPGIGGQDRVTFLTLPPMQSTALTNIPVGQGTTNGLANAPVLNANSIIGSIGCADTPCGQGSIQLFVPNNPNVTWVGVQWMDSFGGWHDVPGWQGRLDKDNANNPFKEWSVFTGQLGQGPFRWVLYTQENGSVVGVSPNFNLPQGGQVVMTTVSGNTAAQ